MANITPQREARFAEKSTQMQGRSGAATPTKKGPAVGKTGQKNGSFPNAPSHKGRGKV